MCDPITIGSAILTGASAAANMSAQSKVEKARSDAMAAERIRQQAFDQQAQALNTGAQDRYQNFEGQQDEKKSSLGDFFKGQVDSSQSGAQAATAAAEPSLMPASSSSITVQNEAAQRGAAKKYTNQQGEALGGMRSFGDLLGGISRAQARDAGYIGQIGGFKKGSSNILGLELEEANNAGSGMKLFGDILGGLGKVGLSAGLSGGSLFGGNGLSAAGQAVVNDPLGLSLPASAFKTSAATSLPTFARGPNPFNLY